MSTEALKEQARRHEQREDWGKALEAYTKVVERRKSSEDPDIALYNRIGDLQIRLGNVAEAVGSYETAIDLYVEAELPNNAVAICRKIIRNDPARADAFLRLGRLRAEQGFVVEARESFLSYAQLMEGRGKSDDAFAALEEFVDLAPQDVETRLFVAEQLVGRDRGEDALMHFSTAYGLLVSRDEEAAASVLERIHAIDPDHPVPDAIVAAPVREPAGETSGLIGFESTALGGDEIAAPGAEEEPEEEQEEEADEDLAFSDISFTGDDDGSVTGDDEGEEEEASEPLPTFDAAEDLDGGFDLDASAGADEADGEEDDPASDLEDLGMIDLDQEAEAELPDFGLSSSDEEGDLDFALSSSDEEANGGDTSEVGDLDLDSALGAPVSEVEEDEGEPLPLMDFGSPDEDLDGEDFRSDDLQSEDGEPEEVQPGKVQEGEVRGGLDGFTLDSQPAASEAAAEASVAELRERVEAAPEDGEGWHLLGRALLAQGESDEGSRALDRSHPLLAARGRFQDAVEAVQAILQINPDGIELHRRAVEYAHQTDDRSLLIRSFIELAEALARIGERAKSDAVFERVVSLDPGNARAHQVLGRVAIPGRPAPPPQPAGNAPSGSDESDRYVDLASLVLDEDEEASTRWIVVADDPTGDEQADFAKMLAQFKDKVTQNLAKDDAKAHYDLGMAYKEMGLSDEAIGEFQLALKARPDDLPTVEMLGHCFLEKNEAQAAIRTLERGLGLPISVEDELLGIYYFLGRAHQQLGNVDSAKDFYEKIFALDINFEDVTERLRSLR